MKKNILTTFIVLIGFAFMVSPAAANTSNNEIPVVFVSQKDGKKLIGAAHITDSKASFSMSDGKLVCAGSFNVLEKSKEVIIPIMCNDKRTGKATLTRSIEMSGHGTVTFNDGYTGKLYFGTAANVYKAFFPSY